MNKEKKEKNGQHKESVHSQVNQPIYFPWHTSRNSAKYSCLLYRFVLPYNYTIRTRKRNGKKSIYETCQYKAVLYLQVQNYNILNKVHSGNGLILQNRIVFLIIPE